MPAADVDPEARERLAALGYVGTFVASASDPRTGRADPKDKIGLFNKLGHRDRSSKEREGDPEASFSRIIGLLNEVVHEDPQVIDAWFMLGTQYLAHGDLEKAVEYFKQTLTLKPDYDLAVFNLAQAYRRMGNDEAALAGFEHYLTLDPKDPFVQYQMGEIWLDRGDLPRAEQLFRRALEIDPSVAAAKNALGVIALAARRPGHGRALIREALAAKPTLRLAHFNLALLAEQRGDVRDGRAGIHRGTEAAPGELQGGVQPVEALRTGRRSRRTDRRAEAVDRQQPAVRRRPLLPGEAVPGCRDRTSTRPPGSRCKGLELAPRSEYAPLGHYVLADIYNRQGRAREGAQELARGRALEEQGREDPGSNKPRLGESRDEAVAFVRLGCCSAASDPRTSSVRRTSPDARPARQSAPCRATVCSRDRRVRIRAPAAS